MAQIDPPELRGLAEFMAGLSNCSYGCPNEAVYLTPTFRAPASSDTIDIQGTEIIARYEREADGQLRWHLAEHQSAFRETTYRAWLGSALPAMARQLTATLPADLRAAGVRFEWAEQR